MLKESDFPTQREYYYFLLMHKMLDKLGGKILTSPVNPEVMVIMPGPPTAEGIKRWILSKSEDILAAFWGVLDNLDKMDECLNRLMTNGESIIVGIECETIEDVLERLNQSIDRVNAKTKTAPVDAEPKV